MSQLRLVDYDDSDEEETPSSLEAAKIVVTQNRIIPQLRLVDYDDSDEEETPSSLEAAKAVINTFFKQTQTISKASKVFCIKS
jgi:predicted DNA-binding protein (UPF0251 family)